VSWLQRDDPLGEELRVDHQCVHPASGGRETRARSENAVPGYSIRRSQEQRSQLPLLFPGLLLYQVLTGAVAAEIAGEDPADGGW
jgi:hypothetical protein